MVFRKKFGLAAHKVSLFVPKCHERSHLSVGRAGRISPPLIRNHRGFLVNQRRSRSSRWRLFGGSRRRRSASDGGFVNMLWTVVPLAGFIGTYFWGENFWRETFTEGVEWVKKIEAPAVSAMLEDAGLPAMPPMRTEQSTGSNSPPVQTHDTSLRTVDKEKAFFNKCTGRKRFTCVVDGDTIWYKGQKIRLADINAPETSKPQCATERALGERATKRLTTLLNQGAFSLGSNPAGKDTDFYGRRLATIDRDGQSLGMQLVREGLAEEWKGRRSSWC